MSHLRLVQNEPEEKEQRREYFTDFARDVLDFAKDLASCATRIFASWKVMMLAGVGNELAFSTALLLGGVPVFDKSTNWMKRTRVRINKVIKNV